MWQPNYTVTIPEEQKWKSEEMKFDPDSSPIAWGMYVKKYKKLNISFSSLKKEGLRLISNVPMGSKSIKIAGDCSFNFNDDKKKLFNKIIDTFEKSKHEKSTTKYIADLRTQLEKCCKMHHTLNNFDLMPVTGGLNNLKGKLKYKDKCVVVHSVGRPPTSGLLDRLDTFICFMDLSFKKRNELEGSKNVNLIEIGNFFSNSCFTISMKTENFSTLYTFLSKYKDIYQYCEEFYNLRDKNFINKLIDYGKKEINDVVDLEDYMKLASEFWDKKRELLSD